MKNQKITANATAGKAYGHVPGHTYHDVDVEIRATPKGNWIVEITERAGSSQGVVYIDSRNKTVIGRADTLRAAIYAAREKASRAGFEPSYMEEALSEAENEIAEQMGN